MANHAPCGAIFQSWTKVKGNPGSGAKASVDVPRLTTQMKALMC